MKNQKYLVQKGGNYYFRRRIPGFSTGTSPLFLSLGTKSEFFAHTWLVTLTMEIDDMLDSFLFVTDELPEKLIAKYMTVRLKQALSDIGALHHDAAPSPACARSANMALCTIVSRFCPAFPVGKPDVPGVQGPDPTQMAQSRT